MQASAQHTINLLPHFSTLNVERVPSQLHELLDSNQAELDAVLMAEGGPEWDELLSVLENNSDRLARFWSPVQHLHHVADSEQLRAVYSECIETISAYHTELSQNEALCAAFKTVRAATEFETIDHVSKRVIDLELRDFKLGGVDLPPEDKIELKEIRRTLARLAQQFEENVLDATQKYRKHLTSDSRLAGLPESALALARQTAQNQELEGYVLTLDFPSYLPALTFLDDRELRRELYEAFVTRASAGGPSGGEFDNTQIIESILEQRQALARLLGFESYADYSLATKIAESPAAVIEFLRELAMRSKPTAKREFDELTRFAREELGLENMAPWDVAWCSEHLRVQRYAVSQEDLKPYFPVERVLAGLFELVKRLFGLSIKRCEGIDVWDGAVEFFEVDDQYGETRGFFYLDLYARTGKRGGAWMDECICRWQGSDQIQVPVAYLTCNFTPPVAEKPNLLTHEEVQTLFHEFGHGLHHILTKINRIAVAGINGVAWDAVELPSQLMENWCWEREALDLFSGHFATGEPIPEALFEKMLAAKNFHCAMQMVRQLEFALFDLRIHHEAETATAVQEVLDEVRSEVAVVIPPQYNKFQNSFSHIFAGGYAAGYYSYKWAEVMSADAFSMFEEKGVLDRGAGEGFMTHVLEKGGSEDAMALFEAFRGRRPQVDALLRHSGLSR